jgi:hypothetical protein
LLKDSLAEVTREEQRVGAVTPKGCEESRLRHADILRLVYDREVKGRALPGLIDAHSGKGEDQSDDADPTRALRGASAAGGAADYLLSLRYAEGPFSPRRRFSGKGRFVSFEPILIDFDAATGTFTAQGDGRSAVREGTWFRIRESGVLHDWASADAIAMAIGATSIAGRVTGTGRRSVRNALRGRAGVDVKSEERRGRRTTLYRQSAEVQG